VRLPKTSVSPSSAATAECASARVTMRVLSRQAPRSSGPSWSDTTTLATLLLRRAISCDTGLRMLASIAARGTASPTWAAMLSIAPCGSASTAGQKAAKPR
jgi:hypothetical protein